MREELEQILRKQQEYAKMPRADLLVIVDQRLAEAKAYAERAVEQIAEAVVVEPEVKAVVAPPEETKETTQDAPEPVVEETAPETAQEEPVVEEATDAQEKTDTTVVDLSDGLDADEFDAVIDAMKKPVNTEEMMEKSKKAEAHEKKSVEAKKPKSKE